MSALMGAVSYRSDHALSSWALNDKRNSAGMSLSWRIILASMDFTAGSRPLRRRSPAAPRPASPSHVRTFLEWPYTLQHYTSQTWPHLLVGLIKGFRAQSRKYAAPPPTANSAAIKMNLSCPHIP